jgi:hypothetical protein
MPSHRPGTEQLRSNYPAPLMQKHSEKLFAIDNPRSTELIRKHGEPFGPKCLLHRHKDLSIG